MLEFSAALQLVGPVGFGSVFEGLGPSFGGRAASLGTRAIRQPLTATIERHDGDHARVVRLERRRLRDQPVPGPEYSASKAATSHVTGSVTRMRCVADAAIDCAAEASRPSISRSRT